MEELNNIAYIDGANLHRGIKSLGWDLDYKRFRVWLFDKYNIKIAYLFIGLIPKYKELYQQLQTAGFILVFKEVVYNDSGVAKGNCDADLVLQATCDFYEKRLNKAVIVTSDGDYSCLVNFLNKKQSFLSILSPRDKCSYLLRKLNVPILYLSSQEKIIALFNK